MSAPTTPSAKPVAITPGRIIQQIIDNDPSLVECDLSGNATFTMKTAAFMKDISAGLKGNTNLKRLILSNLGITDPSIKLLSDALKENKTLSYLNLSKNKIGSNGLIELADALIVNSTLVDIDLLGQSQPFGENALSKVIHMFNWNITLKNITWRLQSRQSFAINKLIVRNNEIQKRLSTGKSVMDILPEPRKPDFGGVAGDIPLSPRPAEEPQEDPSHAPSDENPQPSSPPPKERSTSVNSPRQTAPATHSSVTTSSPSTPGGIKPIAPKPAAAGAGGAGAGGGGGGGGGKMLNRYLQAAQATEQSMATNKIQPVSNNSSKRSFFEQQIQHQAAGAAALTQRPANLVRANTHNARASPVEKLASPQPVNSIAMKFENPQPSAPTREDSVTSPRGGGKKVTELWTPREEEVKKTVIELPAGQGASKLSTEWERRLEEEERKAQEARKPITASSKKFVVSSPSTQQPAPETAPASEKHHEQHEQHHDGHHEQQHHDGHEQQQHEQHHHSGHHDGHHEQHHEQHQPEQHQSDSFVDEPTYTATVDSSSIPSSGGYEDHQLSDGIDVQQ